MKVRMLVCVVAGHHWTQDTASQETFPVLRCTRCGRHRGLASETREPEGWLERGGRAARVDQLMDGRIQRRR